MIKLLHRLEERRQGKATTGPQLAFRLKKQQELKMLAQIIAVCHTGAHGKLSSRQWSQEKNANLPFKIFTSLSTLFYFSSLNMYCHCSDNTYSPLSLSLFCQLFPLIFKSLSHKKTNKKPPKTKTKTKPNNNKKILSVPLKTIQTSRILASGASILHHI